MAALLGRLAMSIRRMLKHMNACWYRRTSGAAVAAAVVVLVAAQPALAQMRAEMVSETALRPSGLMAAPPVAESQAGPALARSGLSTPRSEILVSPTTLPTSYSTQFLGSTLQLDLPRYDASGTYVRPKFYVGMKSDSMRNWINSTGLSAERCMLPMVRARTHMSGDGEMSGTLWVYARCTIR
jgi:hypothetical protein